MLESIRETFHCIKQNLLHSLNLFFFFKLCAYNGFWKEKSYTLPTCYWSFPSNSGIPLHEAENLHNLESLPLLMIPTHTLPPPLWDHSLLTHVGPYKQTHRTCFHYRAKKITTFPPKLSISIILLHRILLYYNSSHLSNSLVTLIKSLNYSYLENKMVD